MPSSQISHKSDIVFERLISSTKHKAYQTLSTDHIVDKATVSLSNKLYKKFVLDRYCLQDFQEDLILSKILYRDHRQTKISELALRAETYQAEARIRIYMLRQIAAVLYDRVKQPQLITELGSAGSVVPALAFPTSKSFSVDIDPGIFANEFNYIPATIWDELNLPVQVSYYRHFTSAKAKATAYSFISTLLPNHERVLSNINRTPLETNSIDLGIIFGQPNLWNKRSCKEAMRIVKMGGFMLCITNSDHIGAPHKWKSFYSTDQYQGWWSQFNWRSFEPQRHNLGFIRLGTPMQFQSWEHLARTRGDDGKCRSHGYVVEIFQRVEN
jgi:hypothetical protein